MIADQSRQAWSKTSRFLYLLFNLAAAGTIGGLAGVTFYQNENEHITNELVSFQERAEQDSEKIRSLNAGLRQVVASRDDLRVKSEGQAALIATLQAPTNQPCFSLGDSVKKITEKLGPPASIEKQIYERFYDITERRFYFTMVYGEDQWIRVDDKHGAYEYSNMGADICKP